MHILVEYYLFIKALHIIAVICWMAGMLYLPRIYVYHCQVKPQSEASQIFKVMEYKLLRYIMTPSMIVVLLLGLTLIYINGLSNLGKYFHLKLTLLLIMFFLHGLFARYNKDFAQDRNIKSEKYYRNINEIPAVLMVIIVILSITKPF